jgi:hypothetical protein
MIVFQRDEVNLEIEFNREEFYASYKVQYELLDDDCLVQEDMEDAALHDNWLVEAHF